MAEQNNFIKELVSGLPEGDRQRLASAVGSDDSDLVDDLAPFARAALAEYIAQFTGRTVPGRIADHEQNRLLFLAQHSYGGRLPDPDVVADLFQKTSTAAKTLVRNTATRFRHELSDAMNAAVWLVLLEAQSADEKDTWTLEVRDLALVEHIHELIRRGPGNPRGMSKSTDELHVYVIDRPTLTTLLAAIGETYPKWLKAWKAAS